MEKRAAICIQQYWKMYKFKKRVKLLRQIRDHLKGIKPDCKTLYLQEDLYDKIYNIHLASLQFNQISECECFAFDFSPRTYSQETYKVSLQLVNDSKPFRALTNQITHDLIARRFHDYPLPMWVMKELYTHNASPLRKNHGHFT
jgi:hypothetical protein